MRTLNDYFIAGFVWNNISTNNASAGELVAADGGKIQALAVNVISGSLDAATGIDVKVSGGATISDAFIFPASATDTNLVLEALVDIHLEPGDSIQLLSSGETTTTAGVRASMIIRR